MRKLALMTIMVMAVAPAMAYLLWDNGPFVTGTGNGFGGADTSAIEAGSTSFGFNCNKTLGYRIADNLTMLDQFDPEYMLYYAYQTGSTTTSTFTGAYVALYDQNLNLLAGDYTTNRMTSSVFSNCYRVTGDPNAALANTRPIMALTIDMTWVSDIPAGSYWIGVALTGSLTSGPWAIPKTPSNQQFDDGAQYIPDPNVPGWYYIDGNGTLPGTWYQDIPFKLYGEVPEPASLGLLALGGLALIRRR